VTARESVLTVRSHHDLYRSSNDTLCAVLGLGKTFHALYASFLKINKTVSIVVHAVWTESNSGFVVTMACIPPCFRADSSLHERWPGSSVTGYPEIPK